MHAPPSELGLGHAGSREVYANPAELMGETMSHELPTQMVGEKGGR
jgi:hypothetical protein